jgi:hypothetical protein
VYQLLSLRIFRAKVTVGRGKPGPQLTLLLRPSPVNMVYADEVNHG